jgi:hypothetical protein
MHVQTRLKKCSMTAKFIITPGLVIVRMVCCSITRSRIWVNSIRCILWHKLTGDIGHCWADTEPNLSQISVPQLPTVVRASEIIMKFFDDMS